MILSIDPGASGGLAYIDQDGIVYAEKMPPTMTDIIDRLTELKAEGVKTAILEKTGTYVPGNSGPAAVTFARHNGHLEAALYALGISATQVSPSVWQKRLGALPKDKRDRKNEIKNRMAALYPHLKVTLATADALAILTTSENGGGK